MSKGCGCQTGIFRWFTPPYSRLFYAACCIHDDDYDRGGSERDRKAADLRLFVNCFKKIAKSGFAPAKAMWVTCIALCYYWSVRLLGGNYFKYSG